MSSHATGIGELFHFLIVPRVGLSFTALELIIRYLSSENAYTQLFCRLN